MSAWHVASTRPHHESRVVKELVELGFQAVCPSYRKRVRLPVRMRRPLRGGKERPDELVLVPAFSNYVIFSEGVWQRAQRVDGLTTILRQAGDRDAAAVLPNPIVRWLLGPNEDGVIIDLCETVKLMHRFWVGQGVRVHSGLMTVDGVVTSSTEARTALLTTAGMRMIVPTSKVRAIEPELEMA